MSTEIKKEIQLEIAHVLFIDIVDYSKLSINEQRGAVDELTQIVRATEQFQKAEAAECLIKIATGDGVALVFYASPEAPVRYAVEPSRALKDHLAEILLYMCPPFGAFCRGAGRTGHGISAVQFLAKVWGLCSPRALPDKI